MNKLEEPGGGEMTVRNPKLDVGWVEPGNGEPNPMGQGTIIGKTTRR